MRSFWQAVFVLSCLAYGLFFLWTWRRLWRRGTTDWERFVYGQGVRGYGVFMWIGLGVVSPLWDAWKGYEPLLSRATLGHLLVTFLIAGPINLWAGYWFGRIMAKWSGLEEKGARS